jgi:hypothetical protein
MNINRVCFAGNHTAEPEVNYTPKVTAVVSASIANNEFYGCAGSGFGHLDHDRYYHEGQSEGTTTAPTARGSTCMFEQMLQRAGGDGAGLPSISKRRASVKKRMAWIMAKTRQLAQLL